MSAISPTQWFTTAREAGSSTQAGHGPPGEISECGVRHSWLPRLKGVRMAGGMEVEAGQTAQQRDLCLGCACVHNFVKFNKAAVTTWVACHAGVAAVTLGKSWMVGCWMVRWLECCTVLGQVDASAPASPTGEHTAHCHAIPLS